MGNTQSFLSPGTALTAVVVAGAVGLGYTQINTSPHADSPPSASAKKGKKKKSQQEPAPKTDDVPAPEAVVAAPLAFQPTLIPGQFDPASAASEGVSDSAAPAKPKKGKQKKGKAVDGAPGASPTPEYNSDSSVQKPPKSKTKRPQQQQQPSSSSLSASMASPKITTTSVDTDGSWTRVESRRRAGVDGPGNSGLSADPTTSDTGLASSATGNSSPAAERTEDEGSAFSLRDTPTDNKRTLAEKLLPKPRKTAVDDMLETPDYPTLSRVMRVQPMPDEKPASGFSWGDYEDVHVAESGGGGNEADGEDDGWGVVKSRSRSKIDRSGGGSSQTQAQTHAPKDPESMSKKQRQNANKREAQKAGKAEAEAERLAVLARHKRELERAKLVEQAGKGAAGKVTSGGMKATVDERGKLVWE